MGIRTDNLRRFLARRRWQRCGQAIRAMSRMTGMMRRSRESSPRTVRDGSESPGGENSANGLNSNHLNSAGFSSALCGQNQDSKPGQGLTSSTARVSSPLISANSTRRADNVGGGTIRLISPLASPTTEKRINITEEGTGGVRARLNLLEERLREEAERERRCEKRGLESGGKGGR